MGIAQHEQLIALLCHCGGMQGVYSWAKEVSYTLLRCMHACLQILRAEMLIQSGHGAKNLVVRTAIPKLDSALSPLSSWFVVLGFSGLGFDCWLQGAYGHHLFYESCTQVSELLSDTVLIRMRAGTQAVQL